MIQARKKRKENRRLLTGKGVKVAGQDTPILEHLELTFKDKDVWYIPTVPDQNEGKPVAFKMVIYDQQRIIFENPEYDIPQRIVYRFLPSSSAGTPDSMYVRDGSLVGKGMDLRFGRER